MLKPNGKDAIMAQIGPMPAVSEATENLSPEQTLKQFYLDWSDRDDRLLPRFARGRSNRRYFLTLAAVAFALTVGAFWPSVRDQLFGFDRTDCEALLGLTPPKPVYRYHYLWVCALAGAALTAYWGWCLRIEARRRLRAAGLIGAWLGLAGAVWMYVSISDGQRALGGLTSGRAFELQWRRLAQLKIIECEGFRAHTKASRQELRTRGLKSFAELHKVVMDEYARRGPDFRKACPPEHIQSENKLKCLFIMNYVSGLWALGNRVNVDKPGGALSNELNQWSETPPSVQAYLDAKIGCCADFAWLTKYLLDQEGIENRLTSYPGHVFNEVKLDGRWYVLDSMINIFVEASWEDIFRHPHERDSIVVLLFPSQSSHDDRSKRYRSITPQFRLMTLLRIANQADPFGKTSHTDLPGFFE
jgi:hypothetical protein